MVTKSILSVCAMAAFMAHCVLGNKSASKFGTVSGPSSHSSGKFLKDACCFIFSVPCIHRMNHHAIAMMFVHLSVCLSVHLSGTGMHCDHTVYFRADLSLCLDSTVFWAP